MGRGRKVGIGLGVVALLLVGGLIAGDRIAVNAAEGRIATQVKQELTRRDIRTAGQPTVTISGFPFLTQVIAGEYESIGVRVVAAEARGIRFDTIDLRLARVLADTQSIMSGSGRVTAEKMTGTAVLGWAAVRQALQFTGLPSVDTSAVELSVSDGTLRLRFPLALSGQRVTFTATGVLSAVDGSVKLKITDVKAEGVPQGSAAARVVEQYRKMLAVEVNVPAMPYGLIVKTVETNKSGISVMADADHVVLAG